jgi:hypothetical protein
MFSSTISRLALPLTAWAGAVSCGQATSRQSEAAPIVFEDRLVIEENDDRSPLGIPPAQLPSPGECRLWKPGRPLREQGRAGSCGAIEAAAPPGSWVLFRPQQDPRLVHARVIDPDQSGLVIQIRVYDAARGTYLGSKQRAAVGLV